MVKPMVGHIDPMMPIKEGGTSLALPFRRAGRDEIGCKQVMAKAVIFFLECSDKMPVTCGRIWLFGTEYNDPERTY